MTFLRFRSSSGLPPVRIRREPREAMPREKGHRFSRLSLIPRGGETGRGASLCWLRP